MRAGARNTAATAYRRQRSRRAPGGASASEDSAVTLCPLNVLLLVRSRRRLLELRGGPVDVRRVLEEVLEEEPLALPGRAAECRRLQIREVETRDLRPRELDRRLALERIGVRARRDALVRR